MTCDDLPAGCSSRPAEHAEAFGARTRYLLVEGCAGYGVVNGECVVTPVPSPLHEIVALLLRRVALERCRAAADRNQARSLGEATEPEISAIPDRPTGLSMWFFDLDVLGDPASPDNRRKALEAFLARAEARPDLSMGIDIARSLPEAIAEVVNLIARSGRAWRTSA